MLAGDTQCVAELRHGEAGRSLVEESSRGESRGVEGVDVEPQSVAFEEQSRPSETTKITRRDSFGWIRRTTLTTQRLDHRMSEERIHDTGTSYAIAVDDQIGHGVEDGALTFVEQTEVES